MMTRRILVSALVCGLAVASVRTAGAAGFTDPKCASAKQKAAAKKEAAKLNCQAKAATKPPLDPVCIGKAETAFSTAFTKADAKGACVGLAPNVEAQVDGCISHLVTDIPVQAGLEKCTAAKLKAGGKVGAAKLGCYAKAVGKGGKCSVSIKVKCRRDADCPTGETCILTPVDPACLAKGDTALSTAFTKADAKGVCPGDPIAVGADIDSNCVTDIKNGLPGQPPGCGNTVVEGNLNETCDDGNSANGDGCPANCHVDSCTQTASTLGTHITYTGPPGVIIAGLGIFVDYPEGKVGGPTFTNSFGVGNVTVDLGYGFNASPIKTTGLPTPFMGANYKTCQGAPAAVASDFTCTVTDASDDGGNVVPANQVTCSVTIP
jgi:cysteine-rich repeat protein